MKKTLSILLLTLAAAPVFAADAARYLVATRPNRVAQVRAAIDPADAGTHEVRTFENVDAFAATLTGEEVVHLRRSRDVRLVERVVERTLVGSVPAPRSADAIGQYSREEVVPYGVDMVRARDLWHLTRGASSTNVVVIDTGIDAAHPDLEGVYLGGFNAFDTEVSAGTDDHSHGTHVSGTIAARDNDFGVIGVAPDLRLWAAKALDSKGTGSSETVMACVDWVISKKRELGGNWIMSLSLGSTETSVLERATFQRAFDEGIIGVAAAGNRAIGKLDYPAAYTGMLAVTSIDEEKRFSPFSSWGAGSAFTAPGQQVLSTVPVGTVAISEVVANGKAIGSSPLIGAKRGEIRGEIVPAGYGTPADLAKVDLKGKVALLKRGEICFRDKTRAAILAGAKAVVIYNNEDVPNMDVWTLLPNPNQSEQCPHIPEDVNYPWGVVVGISLRDGLALETALPRDVLVANSFDDYTKYNGTSMATPHVTAVAALLWSLAPAASANGIVLAMKMTAADLGTADHDERFGYGLVDALNAAKYLKPSAFGLPSTPPPDTGGRRRAIRR